MKMAIPEEKNLRDHRTLREIEPLTASHAWTIHRTSNLRLMLKRANHVWKRRSRVSREQYHSYFKFALVRNPWGRVFSWYKNVMRDAKHRKRLGVDDRCSFKECGEPQRRPS